MKKMRIIQFIQLVLLVVVAVSLIAFLSFVARSNSGGRLSTANKSETVKKEKSGSSVDLDFNFFSVGMGQLTIQKEESVSQNGISAIELKADSADIIVSITDDDTIKIVESSTKKLRENEVFTLTNQNGVLTIGKGKSNRSVVFFGWNEHRIELFIPKSYIGDLSLYSSSGDTRFLSDLNLGSLSIEQASGDVKSSYNIKVQTFNSHLASGDIYLNALACDKFSLGAASGDITIGSLEGAGDIETSSGDILVKAFNGGNYQIRTASGDVKIQSAEGTGEISTASGDIDVSYVAVGDYAKLSAASGDIRIGLSENISFEMDARCTSGEISGNFDMIYRNKKENEAEAVVGEGPYAKLIVNTTSGDVYVKRGK